MARSVSPGYLLACLLAGHDLSAAMLCRRSGLSGREVTGILSGRRVITPQLAEKLGAVFHSPGFWVGAQAWHILCQAVAPDSPAAGGDEEVSRRPAGTPASP